ncbi:MAG: hypothetical protein MJK04_09520 [Psychrosphaera sp.]|nr:hypothetical protein [Psychrosphaera sp.]
MDKLPDGSSGLVPLTDYSPRKDENLQRGYLDGRYKGTPITSVVEVLRARSE